MVPPPITTRLSLQPPCGLPSPISAIPPQSTTHNHTSPLPDISHEDDPSSNTLISCFTHLSISTLPTLNQNKSGPIVNRFPAPATPVASSKLGSREEQRKIYLGPKLSDRATGGPDAGPLIERFSCLFKDRRCCWKKGDIFWVLRKGRI
jgi:1-aminocyclopropane-1-carboxylate synthase